MLGQETAVLFAAVRRPSAADGGRYERRGFQPGRHQREGRWETGSTGRHGLPVRGNTAHVPPGAVPAAGVETGKASSKGTGAGGGL